MMMSHDLHRLPRWGVPSYSRFCASVLIWATRRCGR